MTLTATGPSLGPVGLTGTAGELLPTDGIHSSYRERVVASLTASFPAAMAPPKPPRLEDVKKVIKDATVQLLSSTLIPDEQKSDLRMYLEKITKMERREDKLIEHANTLLQLLRCSDDTPDLPLEEIMSNGILMSVDVTAGLAMFGITSNETFMLPTVQRQSCAPNRLEP